MQIFRQIFFFTLVLLLIVETTQSVSDDTNSTEIRKGRVNGRIVKLYSGKKPDPVICLDEGFKADPIDCTVFYRCTKASKGKYAVFKFQCGPGTVYDPETEVCNHASNTKRSECGGLMQTAMRDDNDIEVQELPSPINTASSIYPSQSESRNITEFSPTTQFTERYLDYKPTTFSYPLLTTTEQKYVEHTNHLPNYQWMNSQNKTQNVAIPLTTIPPNAKNSFPCISEGFVGDSDDCRKFYRCVSNSRGGFVRYEFSCSESTVWDDNIQSCNHAWAVRSKRCGRSDNLDKNSSSYIDQTFDKLIQNKPLQSATEIKVDEHHNYDDNDIYDGNSSEYGNKLNDKWQLPVNNQEILVTEIQNKLTENHELVNKEQYFDTNELSHYDTTVSSYPSNNLQQNQITQTTANNRSNKCIQSGFMADSGDCKKFYRCVDNGNGGFTKYEFSCSQQTVWDSKIEACNHAWAVKECGGKLLPETSTYSNKIPTSVSTSTLSYIKEENDYGYINQINEEHIQTTSSTILTTISLLSTTEAFKSTHSECSSSGFFGDPTDCQKFYRCINNDKGSYIKYDYKCGEGTLWDQHIESCNHVWAVKTCNQTQNHKTTPASHVPNRLTTVSFTQSKPIVNNQDYESDSGYNNQQSVLVNTTPLDRDVLKTTLGNPQTQNNECHYSGFMSDIYDCKKFYRCVDNGNGGFTRHEFSCGEGTVWDSEIEACNHAWAVKNCGTGNIQLTNNTNDVSSRPIDTSGYENEIGYITQSNVKPDNFMTTTTMHISSTVKTITTKNEYECKSDGFIGDQNNCKKFYRCVDNGNGGFIQHEFSCGEGTAWDSKINACNHEWAVENCGTNSVTQLESFSQKQNDTQTIMTSPNPQMQQTQKPMYSTMSTSATQVNYSNSKKSECSNEGFFANPNDCKKFFRCVNDGKEGYIKYDFSCGDGTIWVQELQACDHDTDVNCSYTHSIATTVKYEINTSTVNSITSGIEDENEIHEPNNKECVTEGFYPDSNDCRNFYRCVDKGDGHYIKYEFSCAEGTAWDVTIGSCNYLDKVNSCNGLQIKPVMQDEQVSESEQEITTATTSKSTTALPTTSKSTTSLETTSKSTTTKVTTTKSTIEPIKPANKDVCEQDGYYGNTQDCSKFYRCVSNENGYFTKYDYTCGEGTIWDRDIIACNHPQDVINPSCENKESSSATTASSSTQYTSDDNENTSQTTSRPISTSTSASNTNKTNSSCSNNTSESSNTNNNITCKNAGFYANPSDCKKFYRCVDWDSNGEKFSIFHFECGDGTIWDPSLETCNHEDSVYPPRNCNGTQQQNENMSESTSTTEKASTTTTQKSTTKQSTTEQSTSQKSTTQESTTQPLTTEQSTTVQPTTQRPTTKQSTTQQLTTQQSTTQQSTTQQSTTQQSTTQQSTTQQSTTQQSTTQQSTTQQSTTKQSTTQQSTTQQSTTQQSTTQESTTQESTTQQLTTQQSTTQESTTQASTTDKSTTQQATESTQTTQEQTTKSTTEQTTSTEVAESNNTSSTESSEKSTTSDSTTQHPTTADTSQSETSTTEVSGTSLSTTESQTESSTESTTSNQECPDIDKDQNLFVCPTSFKRHPKYCNLFYQCTEDNDSHEVKVAVFHCPNNTIYDESKIQCIEENKSDKKCNGQIAKKYRVKRLGTINTEPIIVTNESMSCPTSGHFPFEKRDQCSAALLKCELTKSGELRGFVYRCPEGYVYWSISRRCEPLKKLTDCKKPSDAWTRRYDIPIEIHNVGR